MAERFGGIGSWVAAQLNDKRFGGNHVWQITGEQSDRLVVQTSIEGVIHSIAVKREACQVLTILPVAAIADSGLPSTPFMDSGPCSHVLLPQTEVPCEPSPAHIEWTEPFLDNLAAADAFNQPISLPDMGGNSVTLVRLGATDITVRSLLQYTRLAEQGIGLLFHIMDFNKVIGMKFFDILVWCPAKHVWPYCSWCQKVVFPAEDHRASHRHQRALQRAQDNGIAWTVREMLSRHCHRPQLHEMDHWLHASRGIGAPPSQTGVFPSSGFEPWAHCFAHQPAARVT